MSGAGGGAIILHLAINHTHCAHSTDGKHVHIHNGSSSELHLSQADVDGYASQYITDPNTECHITVTDSGVTVDAGA